MWIKLKKDWQRGKETFTKGQIVEMDDGSGKAFIGKGMGEQVKEMNNAIAVHEQEEKEFLRAEPTIDSRKARKRTMRPKKE